MNNSGMEEIARLYAVIQRVSDDPWVCEQNHESLVRYLIEETYEAAEAIEHGTQSQIVEELGDVLFQVVLHSVLAENAGTFSLADVANGAAEKMIRRHPHVFENPKQLTVAELHEQWEKIKSQEKPTENTIFSGIPQALPALLQSAKIVAKLPQPATPITVSGRWERADSQKSQPEPETSSKVTLSLSEDTSEEELGELLFSIAAQAKSLGLDAERALRTKNWEVVSAFNDEKTSSVATCEEDNGIGY